MALNRGTLGVQVKRRFLGASGGWPSLARWRAARSWQSELRVPIPQGSKIPEYGLCRGSLFGI